MIRRSLQRRAASGLAILIGLTFVLSKGNANAQQPPKCIVSPTRLHSWPLFWTVVSHMAASTLIRREAFQCVPFRDPHTELFGSDGTLKK